MLIYSIFYALIIALFIIIINSNRKTSHFTSFIIFFILLLFAGLRGFTGSDTISYVKAFQLARTINSEFIFYQFEPFFSILLIVIGKIFSSGFYFILIFSLIQTYILYIVYKGIKNKIFLLVYVLLFFLNFHFNTIRAGLAALLILLLLVTDNIKLKVILAIVAPGIHSSILFFYPFFIFKYKKSYYKIYLAFSLIATTLIYLNSNYLKIYFDKIDLYDFYLVSGQSFVSNVTIMQIFYLLASIFIMKNTSFKFKLSGGLIIIFFALSQRYPIIYRMIILSQLFYFYFMLERLNESLFTRVKLIFLWPHVFLIFTLNFTALSNETNNLNNRTDVHPDAFDSTYIPYKFYWNDINAVNY